MARTSSSRAARVGAVPLASTNLLADPASTPKYEIIFEADPVNAATRKSEVKEEDVEGGTRSI